MAAAGFAGLPRFMAPAAAVIAVLGAVGVARAGSWLLKGDGARLGPARWAAVAALALGLCVQAGVRAASFDEVTESAREAADRQHALFELIDSAGAERLTACGDPVISRLEDETALAWRLELPMSATHVASAPVPGEGAFISEHGGEWSYATSCTSASASARITGVSGAAR
jgi:hypothetical protein